MFDLAFLHSQLVDEFRPTPRPRVLINELVNTFEPHILALYKLTYWIAT